MGQIDLIGGASGGQLVIIKRLLADRARESHRQFSAWIGIAKEDIRHRRARFDPRIPRFKNRGHMGRRPFEGQWTSIEQDKHRRFSQGRDGFQKCLPDCPAGRAA